MLKVLFLFISISSLYSSEFEIQTPDLIIQDKDSEFLKNKGEIKPKEFVQENSIYKPDPLLETVQEGKEEATLLEKIFLQMDNKDDIEQKNKITKEVFKKPLNKSNELITPDPLLDEI